jgi:fucose 4-O-acetylase-like acetyltransferase
MTRAALPSDRRTELVPVLAPTDRWAVARRPMPGERLAYLDNLKTLLIAGIIASHAINGYADFGSWTYQDVREGSLSPVAELLFVIATVTLGGLFLMALFFLISGLLTTDSLERKGPSRFVPDRVMRLGTPFAAYTLVVWPLLEYSLFGPFRHRPFWDSVLDSDPYLDNGPMWFVGVLLLFSLGLVALWRLRPPSAPSRAPLRWRSLVLLALSVGLVTFVLRIGLPANSNQILNLHVWGWPEYLAMFGLGVVAARNGWLRPVPRDLARRCGIATIVAMLLVASFVGSAEPLGLDETAYLGGFRVFAFLAAMSEGVLAVAAPIWVLAFVQRYLNGTGRLRKAAARSSYAAFMLQGPVLVALALALRPTSIPIDLKALLVASLGIVGSFALAWPLVTRTPLRRFL